MQWQVQWKETNTHEISFCAVVLLFHAQNYIHQRACIYERARGLFAERIVQICALQGQKS